MQEINISSEIMIHLQLTQGTAIISVIIIHMQGRVYMYRVLYGGWTQRFHDKNRVTSSHDLNSQEERINRILVYSD